jgi:hypothetical protein
MKKQKRKTESELPTWLIKARKKQSKVWNKLTKEGYGKLCNDHEQQEISFYEWCSLYDEYAE